MYYTSAPADPDPDQRRARRGREAVRKSSTQRAAGRPNFDSETPSSWIPGLRVGRMSHTCIFHLPRTRTSTKELLGSNLQKARIL